MEGRLLQGPDPLSGGLTDWSAFAEVRALPPVAVPECENDEGGQFTVRRSGDSHPTFRPSACAVASCGLAARPPVCRTGRIVRGGSDPPVRGPGTGSGRGGNSHLVPALPGSLPHQQSLAGRPSERRFGTRRTNPILLRLPPLPKLPAPLSCQRGGWLRPPTAVLAPTPRSASAPTQRSPSGFHPPSKETAGSRRPSGLPRVGLPPPCASSGLPAKDCWTRSDPPRRLGMECTSQPRSMPHRVSKKVGRYGHGLRFRRGTAVPEAVVQAQAGQRHARSP